MSKKEYRKALDNHISDKTLEFLKDKDLFEKIVKEFDKKIVGEEKSKRAIFLSLCSVWVANSEVPLNTLVSSESSAGKSFVCKNIIKLFPEELVVYRTKITPEAFTYWKKDSPDWSWEGRICYLEDISQSILDAPTFKVMCSEGSIATIVIKQKAVDINIKGKPVMLITTARTNPNTEILNRFQIVSLDESAKQTREIIFRQAKQDFNKKYDDRIKLAFRSLKRKNVEIPYMEKIAQFLQENYNFNSIRLRRDFSRLMDLIRCSSVLHQYQREGKEGKIMANEQDYQIAREVINYIQTATFKGLTHKLKKSFEACKELGEFTASEIHSKFPFVSQKMWYKYLDDLCERGMLTTELKKVEDSKKRVTYYSLNKETNFELPEFDLLPQNITSVSLNSFNSNVTNVTNDKDNCNKCNNLLGNSINKELSEEQVKQYYRDLGEDVGND